MMHLPAHYRFTGDARPLDQGTPVPIRLHLRPHEVRTVAQQGWDRPKNGDLLVAAEAAGFDVLLTIDKNIR